MFRFFEDSPDEVILKTLSELSISDLKSLQLVSKKLLGFARDFQIWKSLFRKHFGITPSSENDLASTFALLCAIDRLTTLPMGNISIESLWHSRQAILIPLINLLDSCCDKDTILANCAWVNYLKGKYFALSYDTRNHLNLNLNENQKNEEKKKSALKHFEKAIDAGLIDAILPFSQTLATPFNNNNQAEYNPLWEKLISLTKKCENKYILFKLITLQTPYVVRSLNILKNDNLNHISILEESAKQGNADCQWEFGVILLNSRDVNLATEVELENFFLSGQAFLQQAADQNPVYAFEYALFLLGQSRIIQANLTPDFVYSHQLVAITYLENAAKQNNFDAAFLLGSLYYKRATANSQNPDQQYLEKALKWLKIGASSSLHDNTNFCMKYIQDIYSGKYKVTADVQQFIYWSKKLGDNQSLAKLYLLGNQVPQDLKKADHYFKNSSITCTRISEEYEDANRQPEMLMWLLRGIFTPRGHGDVKACSEWLKILIQYKNKNSDLVKLLANVYNTYPDGRHIKDDTLFKENIAKLKLYIPQIYAELGLEMIEDEENEVTEQKKLKL